MTRLSVVFLGTSSATPTKSRSLPSIGVKREGEVILMDCGEGAQRQFVRHSLGLNREMLVLITHLHGDHVNGLLGLLQTMSMSQRVRRITIVAPAPLRGWLETTMRVLHIGLSFAVDFIATRPGTVYRGRDYRVLAAKADHSIEAYCFLLEEHARPGAFNARRARELGIPEGKMWSRLQHGRPVTVDGRTFRPGEVLGPRRPGRRVGYSGDTRPSARLGRFFRGADLLILDSTFAWKDRDKAVERKHGTALEAAELAKAAGARRLVLTHFSARYRSTNPLLKEARDVFPETVAAKDGLVLDVPYPAGSP